MDIQAIDISKIHGAPKLWQEIVDASSDGWIWHTWLAHEFNLCAGEKFKATDHSFFIYEDGKAVGVVPLIIQEKTIGDVKGHEAIYYSSFLPWPCFRADIEPKHAAEIETFAFTELERRAREAGASRIVCRMTPPTQRGDEHERVARVAKDHHYLYLPLTSHLATVSPQTFATVRAHYDYKHFSKLFTVTIAEGSGITDVLEETYFKLHTQDAGGQFRSRQSYEKQADVARKGEGFYVVARHKESSIVAGMALISCYKGVAYYNSVAIDPAFQKLCVGYQLQCRTIEELLRRGITLYDLGPQEDVSTWHMLTSDKKRGIARFKDKFVRHQSRDIYHIEKFLDERFFDAYLHEKEDALRNYFAL